MRIVVYDGHAKNMIWDIPKLVESASHVMTLYPGDPSKP